MRPLKFRVWHQGKHEWVHGPGDEVNLFGETIFLGEFLRGVRVEELNDCVAEQFTGLIDSKEREIYEGDIVRNEVMPPRLVQFGSFEDSDGYEVVGWHLGLREALDTNPNVYVVGNVHEDAALLEGPK